MSERITPQFGENAQKVLCKRYLLPRPNDNNIRECSYCGNLHETPEQMLDRVSFGNPEYYNMMAGLDFLPGSPALFNAGTDQGTLSACFKFDVEDSLASIMDVARKAAFVLKWGGGAGYCLSKLRGEGSLIKTTHGKACGPLAVLDYYDGVAAMVAILQQFQGVAKMITQGGKREAAQMGVLHCTHPDIWKFIHCKDDGESLSTFNLSVACTDEFMERAINGVSIDLISPQTGEVVGDVMADTLFDEMVKSAWKTGDPGIFFIDAAERANPTPNLGKLTGTNPCGEVPLLDNEPCNLGSINLSNFVLPDNDFDFTRLESIAGLAVRYLDEVLDRNEFPDPTIDEAAQRTRKVGLGVMGWADALALMHIHYDTEQAIELGGMVMRTIREAARDESMAMATEKGRYPAADPLYDDRRNATLTCIAPTGTVSILVGCSSGIEPHFTLKGDRIMGDGTKLVERVMVLDRLEGFVPKIAHEISWEWHIKHQVAFQEHTDLAVSKTINMPNDATPKAVRDAFIMAWKGGCKGITIYRDGSRDIQVLTRQPLAKPRDLGKLGGRRRLPDERTALTHKFVVGGTKGYLHIGLYPDDDTPAEIFIRASKQGSTINGLLDALAIITSIALQYGVPLEALASKLTGSRFEPAGLTANANIPTATSILDYIFRYMCNRFDKVNPGRVETGLFCPECSAPVIMEGGCQVCIAHCGWTRC